jgi:hypothetical protein
MGELSASLTHQRECNLNMNPSKVTTLVEGTDGSNTSKVKLSFNLSGEKNDSTQGKWADLNPFEVLNGENERSDFLRKFPEELEGGWTFQGKKKNKVRIDTIRPESNQSPHPPHTSKDRPRGEKRSDLFKTPSILLYLLRNPSPNQCGCLQSPSLASTHKRKRPPKGGTNTFQKPISPQPSNWHQNHRG